MAKVGRLPRATPESQGVSSSRILTFIDALEKRKIGMHSLMMLRHGNVIAEGWWYPYKAEHPHVMFSLSKSFTSTAAGIAIAEGLIGLHDPVVSFFPDDLPAEVSPNLAGMRVRQLLSMSTGHQDDTLPAFRRSTEGHWVRAFLGEAPPHKPGTHFLYNNGASYMVSAIIQKVTGQTVLDYLWPRLLEPLGIEGATWSKCPRGINCGGWGLNITTEDIAAFGQLYLQRGSWHGRQLIPAEWVTEATSRQVSNGFNPDADWDQGYGYQFWRCRHSAYRGDGAFGQFCVVLPDQDSVIAITGGQGDMSAVLNAVWEFLLPAYENDPLPEASSARTALTHRLSTLVLEQVQPRTTGPSTPISASYVVDRIVGEGMPPAPEISAIHVEASGSQFMLTIDHASGRQTIVTDGHDWQPPERNVLYEPVPWTTEFDQPPFMPIATSGGWIGSDTYELRVCRYHTPFVRTFKLGFDGDKLILDTSVNAAFGPTVEATFECRRIDAS